MQEGVAPTIELQRLLATPPPTFAGAQNPHAIAHASLEALRDSGDPSFLFLRTILEIYSSPFEQQHAQQELLFHCITGARQVILVKFSTLSTTFRNAVRDLFLVAGHAQQGRENSRVIQLAYYNACSSFWKRGWIEQSQPSSSATATSSEGVVTVSPQEESLHSAIVPLLHSVSLSSPHELFRYLEIQFRGLETLQPAALFLSNLLGEFSGRSSSNYKMPLEFHKKSHHEFEQNWLTTALRQSMDALSNVVTDLLQHQRQTVSPETALAVVQLTIDVLGWNFGSDSWEANNRVEQKILLHPPESWGDSLLRPDLISAIVQVHHCSTQIGGNSNATTAALGHGWRQLLLLLASLTGSIFTTTDDRSKYCNYLVDATLVLYQSILANNLAGVESSQILDTLSLTGRIVGNFKLSILIATSSFPKMLESMAAVGRQLLRENLRECEEAGGDFEMMENREWREEAIVLLLEGIVLLCGDPWLLYSGSEDHRLQAQTQLGKILAPIYSDFVVCRTKMARLEEQYLAAHDTEIDELREEIFAVDLEEEMFSLANLGRLDLKFSLSCLSHLFQGIVPQLRSLWDGPVAEVSPQAAGMLEECRLMTLYITHLLTDDNTGETPVIPDSIVIACQNTPDVSQDVSSAVQTLFQFAETQASKIAINPGDLRLSPFLAKSFLIFLKRFQAYILPVDYGAVKSSSPIMTLWASPEAVGQTLQFCITLCLHYQCYWPHERQVQENCAELILLLAKRGTELRLALVTSPPFRQLLEFHRLTSGIRHSAPPAEFESSVSSKCTAGMAPDINQLRGYQRLPYDIKSRIATALLVGCSESDDQASTALFDECVQAIHDSFSILVQALS